MSASSTEFSFPRGFVPAAAALLLAVFAILCLQVARNASPTFDEPEQVGAGYASLTQAPDHGYSALNLRLSQVWEALPLLAFDPRPQFPSREAQAAVSQQSIGFGRLFFFASGNDTEAMLFASRAMVIVLGLALGGILFLWSRRLHGDLAGLLTLTLYALCPLVIANSSIATTEIATTLLFTVSVFALWRLLHRVSLPAIVSTGLAVGALAATKITGLLIAPMAVILVVVRMAGGRSLETRLPGRVASAPHQPRWGLLLGALAIVALVAWLTVWAVYGGIAAAPPASAVAWEVPASQASHLRPKVIAALRAWGFLPESYLSDLHRFLCSGHTRRAFLLGEYSMTGWWYFFPVAALVKNTLPFLLALGAGLAVAWQARKRPPADGGVDYYALAPLLVLGAVYGGFAMGGNLNIGARHLLPLYPLLLVFAGLAVRLPLARRSLRIGFLAALGLGSALEVGLVHPFPLAYFNALAGGPAHGYRILSDSSADWGESLLAVRRWLEARKARTDQPSPVFFSYFGCADLAHYGLTDQTVTLLPQYYDTRPVKPYALRPGTYLISTTMLNCIYNGEFMGPWQADYEKRYQALAKDMEKLAAAMGAQGQVEALFAAEGASLWMKKIDDFDYLRFGRLCAHLRKREPDSRITYGMHVYEVGLDELREALVGPPAELYTTDPVKGRKPTPETVAQVAE